MATVDFRTESHYTEKELSGLQTRLNWSMQEFVWMDKVLCHIQDKRKDNLRFCVSHSMHEKFLSEAYGSKFVISYLKVLQDPSKQILLVGLYVLRC